MAKRNPIKRMIGRYIVSDPAICRGQPTFRGTRILVADVMEQVAGGTAWETVVEEWRGSISADAIFGGSATGESGLSRSFGAIRRARVRT
jgi:uncharacterized protein (DUF433 family)